MKRDYQYDYSGNAEHMFDADGRSRKAHTMLAVLNDCLKVDLSQLACLNVGGSAGIIDFQLAKSFKTVVGIDIDQRAIAYAKETFIKDNLSFQIGDAMNLDFPDQSVEVVISSHVYEHVPDAHKMLAELYRVLKPGGVCFFAAGNRLMWNEPHHDLPLLSVLPRSLAHGYLRLTRKGSYYHEQHFTYWGLKSLTHQFLCDDYTAKLIENPQRFGVDYMIPPDSLKQRVAQFIARYTLWLMPSYVWILRKKA